MSAKQGFEYENLKNTVFSRLRSRMTTKDRYNSGKVSVQNKMNEKTISENDITLE